MEEKHYFSNKFAIIISFGIPILIGLILAFFNIKEFCPAFFVGGLLGIAIIIPLEIVIVLLLKLKRNRKQFDSRYLNKKWTTCIVCVPIILYLLGVACYNHQPINSVDALVLLYRSSRSIMFLSVVPFMPILNFLCLTKRIRWQWLVMWFMIAVMVAFITGAGNYHT